MTFRVPAPDLIDILCVGKLVDVCNFLAIPQMAVDGLKCLLVITGVVPVWSRIEALTLEISTTARKDYNFTYSADAQVRDVIFANELKKYTE